MTPQPNATPLQGVKVIEIGVAMAGPYCGMTLADYGADVIKIEHPQAGDVSRQWGPFLTQGLSYYYAAANRGKRSLALDLKHPGGQEALKALVQEADVLVDNYRVGALDKLGLGYGDLSAINPRLVYCSISGFGATGPRASDRANDLFMQAYAGTMSVTGPEDGEPVKAGISIADLGGAMFGVTGILMALYARERTGRGQHVDTSLLEGQVALLSYHLTSYEATGVVPKRIGNAMPLSVAYRAFKAEDDWVVVGAFNEQMWQGVCRAVGRRDWLEDPELGSRQGRAAHKDRLVADLNAIFATRRAAAWIDILAAEGVPCGPVNTIPAIMDDEQVLARDMVVTMQHPDRAFRMAGLPIKFSDTPGLVRHAAPDLGEHTRAVLAEAGYSDGDIEGLHASGAIGLADRRGNS